MPVRGSFATTALEYNFKSNLVSPSSLLFLHRALLSICNLCVLCKSKDCVFPICEECHWNLNEDCICTCMLFWVVRPFHAVLTVCEHGKSSRLPVSSLISFFSVLGFYSRSLWFFCSFIANAGTQWAGSIKPIYLKKNLILLPGKKFLCLGHI